MQAVILVAGKGTRLVPLTITKPKPFLRVANKTIIEHNLDQIKGLVDEVIFIVGYKADMIKSYFGKEYDGIKLKYVFQKEQLGTGHAAKIALPFLNDKFLIMNGDDFYDRKDIEKCFKKNPCILVKEIKDPSNYGQFLVENDYILDLVEKPEKPISNLINIGFYFLNKSVFDFEIEKSERGEYEITEYLKKYTKKEKLYFEIAEEWMPVSYSWSLLNANEQLMKTKKEYQETIIEGTVEDGAKIINPVRIGENTIIKKGAFIEGPVIIGANCIVGADSKIRKYSVIGNNCQIGKGVSINNSIIGENCKIPHLSEVRDSVIGDDCELGPGTKISSTDKEEKTVKSTVKEKEVDTVRKKFGAAIGDNVIMGAKTIIRAGKKIWPGRRTSPKEVVKKDME